MWFEQTDPFWSEPTHLSLLDSISFSCDLYTHFQSSFAFLFSSCRRSSQQHVVQSGSLSGGLCATCMCLGCQTSLTHFTKRFYPTLSLRSVSFPLSVDLLYICMHLNRWTVFGIHSSHFTSRSVHTSIILKGVLSCFAFQRVFWRASLWGRNALLCPSP